MMELPACLPTTAAAVFAALLVFFTSGPAGATTLPATAVGALRDQVAPYGTINPGDGFFSWLHMANKVPSLAMEDRGFSEFNLTTLVGTPVTAELAYTIKRPQAARRRSVSTSTATWVTVWFPIRPQIWISTPAPT